MGAQHARQVEQHWPLLNGVATICATDCSDARGCAMLLSTPVSMLKHGHLSGICLHFYSHTKLLLCLSVCIFTCAAQKEQSA